LGWWRRAGGIAAARDDDRYPHGHTQSSRRHFELTG
jgi:hypothetical protein